MANMVEATRVQGFEEHEERLNISNVKVVASYNWLDIKEPTILVPGTPPAWTPPKFAPKLEPDTGQRFVDQNAGRSPNSPMEPLFRAVLHEHPEFDFNNIDLITDRSEPVDFTFTAQVVGNTVIFIRKEEETVQRLGKDKASFRGFRDNFDKAYLVHRPDCAKSASHHRVLAYQLGSVRIMLRHKVNGYLSEQALQAMFKTTSLESTSMSEEAIPAGAITIQDAGYQVPLSATLELSTSKAVDTVEKYMKKEGPEQWLSQTPHFIRAMLKYKLSKSIPDTRATVTGIDIRNASKDVDKWRDENQGSVDQFYKQLAVLLHQLQKSEKEGSGAFYTVQCVAGEQDLLVRPIDESEVAGLSGALSERLKTYPSAGDERKHQSKQGDQARKKHCTGLDVD